MVHKDFGTMSAQSFDVVDHIFDTLWISFEKERRVHELEDMNHPYAAKMTIEFCNQALKDHSRDPDPYPEASSLKYDYEEESQEPVAPKLENGVKAYKKAARVQEEEPKAELARKTMKGSPMRNHAI